MGAKYSLFSSVININCYCCTKLAGCAKPRPHFAFIVGQEFKIRTSTFTLVFSTVSPLNLKFPACLTVSPVQSPRGRTTVEEHRTDNTGDHLV